MYEVLSNKDVVIIKATSLCHSDCAVIAYKSKCLQKFSNFATSAITVSVFARNGEVNWKLGRVIVLVAVIGGYSLRHLT